MTARKVADRLRELIGRSAIEVLEIDDCERTDGEVVLDFLDRNVHVQVGHGYYCVVEDLGDEFYFGDPRETLEEVAEDLRRLEVLV